MMIAAMHAVVGIHLHLDSTIARRCGIPTANIPKNVQPLTTTTEAAFRWELLVADLDEGIFGLDSRDPAYGVEIVKLENVPLPLGLMLCEEVCFGRAGELRKMALIEGMVPDGGVASSSSGVRPGDALTWIVAPGATVDAPPIAVERVEGLDLDDTIAAIAAVSKGCTSLTVSLKRLVPRLPVRVQVLAPDGTELDNFEALSGSNLRGELLRRRIPIYDRKTKRVDMPWGTGDCAGEGLCGTCLVELKEDANRCCSPRDGEQELLLSGRPVRWRLACRTYIGVNNVPDCEVKVRLRPQSAFNPEEIRVVDLRDFN